MRFYVYVVSSEDEQDRPYVSTTPPSAERAELLKEKGYQVHRVPIWVPSSSDQIPKGQQLDKPDVLS